MPILPQSEKRQNLPRRPFQYRIRTLSVAVVVLAVWLGLALDPNTRPLVLGLFGVILFGVGFLLAAVVLGALGCGLFAVGETVARWIFRGPEPSQAWELPSDR